MVTRLAFHRQLLRHGRLANSALRHLIFIGWISLGATSALGQAPSSLAKEMLQPTYPEEFFFKAPPKDVWQALATEITSNATTRILVSNADDRVLSWIETADLAAPLARLPREPAPSRSPSRNGMASRSESDNPKPPLATNDVVRLKDAERVEVGEDRVAVTTVLILSAPNGSIARFRRIYYGSHTQPRIAHSTGAYEGWLVAQLAKKLVLSTGDK